MKYLFLIFILLPLVFSQNFVVSPSSACKCKQFLSQKACNDNTLGQCLWNTKTQICQQATCENITSQIDCLISKKNCSWDGQICVAFTSCAALTSQVGLICPQQNVSCYGSNTNQCQSISSLPKCITYKIAICGQQGGYAGSDGLCYWDNDQQECAVANQCGQLLNQQVCNIYIQNACVWDQVQGVCTQATCNQFQNQKSCRFVVANLDQNQVNPCLYQFGVCQQATSQLFQIQEQCQINTLLNYRWVGTDNYGICVSCAQQQIQPANICNCEQIMYQSECELNQRCIWGGNNCQDIPCNQIKNQLSCSTNKNCYWNLQQQTCLTFQSCNLLNGQNALACMVQSINCPNVNIQVCKSVYYECYQLGSYECDGYVTGNGICYYNDKKQVCQNLQSCANISDENICNQISKLCFWSKEQNKCAQVTCSSIKSQKDCTYVVKQLNGSDIQVCQWNNTACQDAKNILTLNETECSINTYNTYMYTGAKCVKCFQVSLILPQQCNCSQLYLQSDCLANPICYWNGQVCRLLKCLSIMNQDLCIQNNLCQWTEYGCSQFQTCYGLAGATPKDCISQTINCPYSDGIKCQNKYYYSPCQSFVTIATCTNQYGSDGLCFWNTTTESCQVLTKCNQILKASNCGIYQYACNWADDLCNQSTCSTFKTAQTCKYYYQSLNSSTPIGCIWNTISSVCEQILYSLTAYTSANCYQNTARTSRWSSISNQQGVCISCGVKYIPSPFKCSCQQLISQLNCVQNQLCYWSQTSNACEEYPCAELTQKVCIQSMKCMWKSNTCTEFTSCNQIKGESMDECLSYSLYCPYNVALKACSNLQSYPKCSEHLTYESCQGLYGTGRQICNWNYQIDKCTELKQCGFLNQQISCEQYSLYCSWTSAGYCQTRMCADYVSKSSCTYVLSLSNPQLIQACQWVNSQCQSMIVQQAVDAQSCFTNTNGTSRWTQNSLTSGICVPCNLPSYAVQYQNKCQCSQILNERECHYPYCYWSTNQCILNDCYSIKSQFECSQQTFCFWKINANYCDTITVKLNFCATLTGKTSLECLAQSVNCPGTLNGFCQDSSILQQCSSITTQAACANSIGQEGYCRYENQSCKVISSCTQIKSYNYCVGMQHLCFWDSETNLCTSITCADIQDQNTCTFIYQSFNSYSIFQCEWNQVTSQCQNATSNYLINKTIDTCYLQTGGTFHWSNTENNGYCVSCSLDLVQLPNTCTCDELTQNECLQALPKCRLSDSGKCIQSECNTIFDQANCSTQPSCMWFNHVCTQFTSCSKLLGKTSLDCLAQSIKCPGVSNGTCQSQSELGSCSSYQTAYVCKLGTASKEGLCYWNGQSCQQMVNCDAISQVTECNALYRTCKWSTKFNKCAPFKCQDYQIQDQCTYVIVNFKNSYVELCSWQNQVCQQYTDKYFRYDEDTCYQNSAHTYRWVGDSDHGTKCQQCYSSLLIAITIIFQIIGF